MKLKIEIKYVLPIIVFSMVFSSCEYNVDEPSDLDGVELCTPDLSFAGSIKPIIDKNCIGCHNGIEQFPDLRAHEGLRTNAERVKQQVVSRAMPQGGALSSEEIELIRCWIDNGSLNN